FLFISCSPPLSTLFPYSPLFRSARADGGRAVALRCGRRSAGGGLPAAARHILSGARGTRSGHGLWRDGSEPRNDGGGDCRADDRSEEHTSELQSLRHLVCRLLLE